MGDTTHMNQFLAIVGAVACGIFFGLTWLLFALAEWEGYKNAPEDLTGLWRLLWVHTRFPGDNDRERRELLYFGAGIFSLVVGAIFGAFSGVLS